MYNATDVIYRDTGDTRDIVEESTRKFKVLFVSPYYTAISAHNAVKRGLFNFVSYKHIDSGHQCAQSKTKCFEKTYFIMGNPCSKQ